MNSIQPSQQKAEKFPANFVQPTQHEVAAALGLSRTQVQTAERSALRKIRLHLTRAGYGVQR